MEQMHRLGTIVLAFPRQGYQRIHPRQLCNKPVNTIHFLVKDGHTSRKCDACDAVAQDHWYSNGHMLPGSHVVSSPDSPEALRSGEEGSG